MRVLRLHSLSSIWFAIFGISFVVIFYYYHDILYVSYHSQATIIALESYPITKKKGKWCRNIEEATQYGYWKLRNNLTKTEINERKRFDVENRLAMDWSAELHRNDSRCGKDYLIPGFRLQAQCDAESDEPCCNQETGQCGIGSDFCECDSCTDQRTMIPAELGEWLPDYSCVIKPFSQDDACEVLNINNISVTFIGDSLIRQLHTLLILILTDDYQEGSIPYKTSLEHRKLCRGEQQVTNKVCSVEIVAHKTDELLNHTICHGKYKLKVDLIQDYHRRLIPEVENKLLETLNEPNHWIIAGVGLHYQLDFDAMKIDYLDKVWDILKTSKNGWPKVLWIGIHGVYGFLRLQTGPDNISKIIFNKKINDYWSERNVTVIETFNMSKGIKSYDGRHYGIGFNKLKIDVILNHLQNMYEQ